LPQTGSLWQKCSSTGASFFFLEAYAFYSVTTLFQVSEVHPFRLSYGKIASVVKYSRSVQEIKGRSLSSAFLLSRSHQPIVMFVSLVVLLPAKGVEAWRCYLGVSLLLLFE
jgi:hypothetical protein